MSKLACGHDGDRFHEFLPCADPKCPSSPPGNYAAGVIDDDGETATSVVFERACLMGKWQWFRGPSRRIFWAEERAIENYRPRKPR